MRWSAPILQKLNTKVSIPQTNWTAGGVAQEIKAWESITTDQTILEVIRHGITIEFIGEPLLMMVMKQLYRKKLAPFLDEEVENFFITWYYCQN